MQIEPAGVLCDRLVERWRIMSRFFTVVGGIVAIFVAWFAKLLIDAGEFRSVPPSVYEWVCGRIERSHELDKNGHPITHALTGLEDGTVLSDKWYS